MAQPGEKIGPYRLLEILGEGGMGAVYLAEQTEPLQRRVALKLIRPGRVDRRAIHRFEAERQALARMNHPNVAQVYEAGDTDLGQPYIAMEYVPGRPITEYCDRHRLTVTERLELFTAVCDGIQHAHQKGVIHRDIKPGNILVTAAPVAGEPGRPVPKVIDFGIAKGMEEPLTGASRSLTGERVLGTPAYLSPEAFQVFEGGADLDTRSDVYALGVVLYDLLVGELPYGSRKESFLVVVGRITHQDPPAPSARFARLDAAVRDAAARELLEQGTDKVQGEYREQPLTRARLLDTLGVVYRKLGLYEEAEPLSGSALEIREELLGGSHAEVATSLGNVATLYWLQGRYAEARPLAERALAIREKALGGEHPDVATSLDDLALVYRRLGKYAEAEPLFRRALEIREKILGSEHRDVAVTLNGLAILYWNQGRYGDAAPLFERALGIWEERLGPDHLEVAATVNNLAGVYRDQGEYAAALAAPAGAESP